MNDSLAAAVAAFLAHKRALGRKYLTEEATLRLLLAFAARHGVDELRQLTPCLLDEFVASRPRQRARSFNHLVGILGCFLDWAVTCWRPRCLRMSRRRFVLTARPGCVRTWISLRRRGFFRGCTLEGAAVPARGVGGRKTPRPAAKPDRCAPYARIKLPAGTAEEPPLEQQHRCADAHRPPTAEDMRRVLDQFRYTSDFLIDDGHVWTHGLGEQRRYAVQHTLQFQIWELDQPHFLHAHGRSLTGHNPSRPADEFADLRARFTRAQRFGDE